MKSPNKSKVAGYIRVSTREQQKGKASQEHAIQQYLDGHNLSVSWFRDELSGKDLKRDGFEALQRAIFLGQVDTVVVWKLDRLSRSLQDGINVLCDWLKRGVRVVAVAQQLDFGGTMGQMIAAVLFGLAEMERENKIEDIKRGMDAARDKGVHCGRPRSADPAQIHRLRAGGMRVVDIAAQLGVTRQTVHSALRQA